MFGSALNKLPPQRKYSSNFHIVINPNKSMKTAEKNIGETLKKKYPDLSEDKLKTKTTNVFNLYKRKYELTLKKTTQKLKESLKNQEKTYVQNYGTPTPPPIKDFAFFLEEGSVMERWHLDGVIKFADFCHLNFGAIRELYKKGLKNFLQKSDKIHLSVKSVRDSYENIKQYSEKGGRKIS